MAIMKGEQIHLRVLMKTMSNLLGALKNIKEEIQSSSDTVNTAKGLTLK